MDTSPPPAPPPAPVPGAGPPPNRNPRSIPNYLWQSIVVTIACCLPLGIPAIVYATRVNTLLLQGDEPGAARASEKAKLWCWIAAGSGVLFGLIYGIAVVILGVMSD